MLSDTEKLTHALNHWQEMASTYKAILDKQAVEIERLKEEIDRPAGGHH